MEKWEARKLRWDAYKQGIRDKFNRLPPQKDHPAYIEGYNETRQHKINKYKHRSK